MRRHRIAVVVCLVLAACGGGTGSPLTTTSAPPNTTSATTTTAAQPSTTRNPADIGGGLGRDRSTTTTTNAGTGDDDVEFVEVSDDSRQITVEVPASWADIRGTAWVRNGERLGPAITAAVSVEGWLNSWAVPGVFIGATTTFTGSVDDVLDTFRFGECEYDARYDYDDGVYAGKYDWWDDCGGIGTTFIVIASRPADGAFTIVVQMQLITDQDRQTADKIVETYFVTSADLNLIP